MASVLASLVEIFASSFSADGNEDSWAAFALLRAEVGTRCWMIVLLTAYLNDGEPPVGEDSEIKERRIEFCKYASEVYHWRPGDRTHNDRSVP